MTRSITELPREILQLIVTRLTSQHHSFVVPLAQTYNKVIYAACSDVLKYRRNIPAAQRAICDIFHDQEYRPGRSRVFADNDEPLSLTHLDINGTLDWLDMLACELRDFNNIDEDEDNEDSVFDGVDDPDEDAPAVLRLSSKFRSALDDLILQTDAVGCRIPYVFIKFFKRYYYYQRLFSICRNDHNLVLEPHLHKVHPREGATGYLIDFLYDRHGGNMLCLYLDPGPARSHALVWTLGCGFDNGHNEDDDDEYMEMFEIKDANGNLHKSCHEIGVMVNMYLLCFDFETWLAGIMCYYSCLDDTELWEKDHLPGSLRRARFLEFIAANPDLKRETWSVGVGEDVRAFLSNLKTPGTP